MDAISIISLFMIESIWFTIYYYLSRTELKEQNMYVQVTYRNPMFCAHVLHKWHG